MPRKVIVVTDAGIDGAFAAAVAALDPGLEVLGLAASAGNVDAEQATPRLGPAGPLRHERDGVARPQRPGRRRPALRPAAAPAPRRQARRGPAAAVPQG